MDLIHNPDGFMSDLRQILSQGRKRVGLLVGAGAPLSLLVKDGRLDNNGRPLIPGADELTGIVLKALKTNEFRSVAASIRAEIGPKANIEDILSVTRLREKVLGTTVVQGLDGRGYAELAAAICTAIGDIDNATLPEQRNAYNELVAWISGTMRAHAIEIFTTNYDLLLEEAFEHARAPYFDGFSGGSSPFFDPVTVASDDLPPRWSRIWKLHGSLGWSLERNNIVRGRGKAATQLIYPDHLKYDATQKQPYAALFERLRQFLLCPDTLLLATGFSFRDAHVCAVLDESLARNANAAVLAFQFCALDQESSACKIAFDRPNLSVYAADGAVINGVKGAWVPGPLPKNWAEIRASFWGTRPGRPNGIFLLGDFVYFARFCALTQASGLQNPEPEQESGAGSTSDAKPST
jgi:hypothetical protein